MDLAYFFQDLRSEALKAMSWPSRCGAIVIPAKGERQTVNCAETPVERTDEGVGGFGGAIVNASKGPASRGRRSGVGGYSYLVASLCH